MVGHRLRTVAGRHRDDAAPALVGRERGELVARAALLERVGDLQVLVFDEDLGAGQRGQPRRRQHRRAQHGIFNDFARRTNVANAQAHHSSPTAEPEHRQVNTLIHGCERPSRTPCIRAML